jgi:Lipid-binding putative hydrolase
MRKIFFSVFVLMIISTMSCQKTFENGTTKAKTAASGWWVTFTQDGNDVLGIGTVFLNTYNTSANDDSIWVDDLLNSWQFKCKAAINYQNLTFSTTNATNEYYPITVNITNGKILLKSGTSKSGVKTDSIYMQVNFSDDAANTYVISGTARTGFIEDDY